MALKSLLGWELKNLTRFPLLELLVAIAVYLSMLSGGWGSGFMLGPGESWSRFPLSIASSIGRHSLDYAVDLYVPMMLAAIVFASIGIAREVEAGFVKVALSHPIRRRALFLVKSASCFLITFTIFAVATVSAIFLQNWTAAKYILSFPATILRVLGLLMLQTFFVVGVATAVAVFSRNTAVSSIGSIGILYLPVYMAQVVGVKIPFVPPESTRLFVFYLRSEQVFWRQYDFVTFFEATVVPVLIAATLLLISFVYFTRRFDVS